MALALVAVATAGPAAAIDAKDKAKEKPRPVNIVVVGDSLADGLWASLYRAYSRQRHVHVRRETLTSSGFTAYNWQSRLEGILRKYSKIDLVVMQVGTNDRQQLIVRRQRWPRFRSEGWVKHYRQRVENFMARLQKAGIPTVWVGLPIVRSQRHDKDYRFMNDIFRDEAKAMSSVAFVSCRDITADEKGRYVSFKRDDRNRRRRFRHGDGIHFSDFGYDLVASHVLKLTGEKWPGLLPQPARKK